MSWNSQGDWNAQWPQQQQQWTQSGQQNNAWQQGNQQGWGQQGWGNAGQAQVKPNAGAAQQMQAQQQAQTQGPQTLVVSTGGHGMDEVVVQTLIGEYVEHGSNHERKIYKKSLSGANQGNVEVFIYYWDARDGDAFEGWWFGNQVGGTQVWSHVKQSSAEPPQSGWKIPWDGAVRQELSVQKKPNVAGAAKTDAMAKVTALSGELVQIESAAQTALEQAKDLAGDLTSVEGMKQAEELLFPQVASLTNANKKIFESQKGASGDVAKAFSTIGQKLRATQAIVSRELGKIRMSKLKAEKEGQSQAQHEKDRAILAGFLPEAIQKTNMAEDAVEKTAITAEMITAGGEDVDEIRKAVDATEKLAKEAQTMVGEARIFLNAKMALAKRFESEVVQKEALEELQKLQAQLQTSQSKLTPLKSARQDFIQRTAAQKLSTEVIAKLTPAEVDVDKAEEATATLFQEEEPTKETVSHADSSVSKALDHINATVNFIESKKKAMPAQGLVRDELVKLEERAQASLNKLQEMRAKQRGVQEKLSSVTLIEEAAEKMQAVQESVQKAADAEGPFLMGVEELPIEETFTAVKACETAATSANTAVSIARMFIATKLVEVKRYSADVGKAAQVELTKHQKQLEALTKKLTELKQSTGERKRSAWGRECELTVTKAEELAQAVAQKGSCFEDDAKLMELSADDVRKAGEETSQAEKEANIALADARKLITAKQIEAKGQGNSDDVSAMLTKFQTRLSTAQSGVSKYKKLCASVEQRLAAKKSVEDSIKKVTEVEAVVKKAHDLTMEMDDLSPEGIGEKAHAEMVKAAEEAYSLADGEMKNLEKFLASQSKTAGAKDEISKLNSRVKEAQQQMEECGAKIKVKAEKATVQTMIAEAEKRVKEAEETCGKAQEAEAELLMGKELTAEKTIEVFKGLETAAQAAHSSVGGTKTFLAMKRLAAKRLAESPSKEAIEALAKLQARLDETSKKLQEVRKGINERKAAHVKQEIGEKVVGVEKQVEATKAATQALESIEASAKFSAEKAKIECEKLASLEKEAQKMMDEALNFLDSKLKELKGGDDETKEFQTRLDAAQSEIGKSKKALSDFEQRFVAKKLVTEATTMVTDLEAEVEKVKTAAAPLLVEGGSSFLAAGTVAFISEALTKHSQKSNISKEDLFKEAGGSAEAKIPKDAFMAYLDKLPEKFGSDDLVFPEDQREGIFAQIDADKDGEIGAKDFEALFTLRYMCVQAISMTDGFEIAKSKTVVKLELDDVVEAIGEPKVLPNGVARVECRVAESGKTGWVTSHGNQGTVYLELFSPYNAFVKATERQMEITRKLSNKTSSFLKTKSQALSKTPDGPLAEAREDLAKLKPRVDAAHREIDSLRNGFGDAKKEYIRKKTSAVEAKDQRAAQLMMRGLNSKAEVMSTTADKLAELAKPFLTHSDVAELEAITTPVTISSQFAEVASNLWKACVCVREGIQEQKEVVAKAPKGPMREAKQELQKYAVSVDAVEKKLASTREAFRKACSTLLQARIATVSPALRSLKQKKDISEDALFDEVAGNQPRISMDAFLKCLGDLELGFPEEHLKMIALHVGAQGGIGRRSFDLLVRQFYKCTKGIAITDEFAISKSKTLRMLDAFEIVEVLEGPVADEKAGVERVRGKALKDGITGWISMKGNKGTPFLQEAQRPCYYCVADVPLEKNYESADGDAPVRILRTSEVVEVVEGPRGESFQGATRARVRACRDGKVGWFSMKTKDGATNVEQSGKHYRCTAQIAMTDAQDIKKCKVLRKLAQHEVFIELEAAPAEDGGVQRIRGRALKDQLEGWITLKGNKGTVYAEEATVFTLVNDTPMQKAFETEGAVLVRTLEKGEAVEVTEGPKEEKIEILRFKGRALSDDAVGWASVKADQLKLWSASYQSVAEAELTHSMKLGSETLATLAKDDIVEALDGPREDDGSLRLQVKTSKDGTIGWVTLRSAEGTASFQHMPKSDGS